MGAHGDLWIGSQPTPKNRHPAVGASLLSLNGRSMMRDDKHSQTGLFLVLEGPDGVGKTTIAGALADSLRREGRVVRLVREPGSTRIGEAVRNILLSAEQTDPYIDLFLFTAARRQLVKEIIEPALRSGEIVISDRFYHSTFVYQGGLRGVPTSLIETVTVAAIGDCRPDATYLLTLDERVWRERLGRRGGGPDRLERDGRQMQIWEHYRSLVATMPDVIEIDASGSPEIIVEDLMGRIRRLIETRRLSTKLAR